MAFIAGPNGLPVQFKPVTQVGQPRAASIPGLDFITPPPECPLPRRGTGWTGWDMFPDFLLCLLRYGNYY